MLPEGDRSLSIEAVDGREGATEAPLQGAGACRRNEDRPSGPLTVHMA